MNIYWQYEELRFGFETLAGNIEAVMATSPSVSHQLIRSPEGHPLSDNAWEAFINANKGILVTEKDQWEHWDILADKCGCSRFYGFESKNGLEEFLRLASTGGHLLQRLRMLVADKVPMPKQVRVNLESPMPYQGWNLSNAYQDFLLAIHDTGSLCHTDWLHVNLGHWLAPTKTVTSDLESAANKERLNEEMTHPEKGGDPFPNPSTCGNTRTRSLLLFT